MEHQEPPARRAICLECRTLYPSDAAHCAQHRRHHVVSLETEQGRDALYREIWETHWIPREGFPQFEWMVAGAIFAPVAAGLVWGAGVAVGVSVAAWSALTGKVVWARRQRSVALTPPRGRPGHLRLLGWRDARQRGIVRSAHITAPLTGRPCVGYSVILRANEFFGGDIMLIDACIGEASVELKNRHTLHLSGPVEIDDPAPVAITDRNAIERYLDDLVPGLMRGATTDLPGAATPGARREVPYDRVTESIIPPDAEVEIVGKTVEVPGLYREGDRSFRMREVPVVRPVV